MRGCIHGLSILFWVYISVPNKAAWPSWGSNYTHIPYVGAFKTWHNIYISTIVVALVCLRFWYSSSALFLFSCPSFPLFNAVNRSSSVLELTFAATQIQPDEWFHHRKNWRDGKQNWRFGEVYLWLDGSGKNINPLQLLWYLCRYRYKSVAVALISMSLSACEIMRTIKIY